MLYEARKATERAPVPSDDPALREDEEPLEEGDLDLALAPRRPFRLARQCPTREQIVYCFILAGEREPQGSHGEIQFAVVDRYPLNLSGGQQQRGAIARALGWLAS